MQDIDRRTFALGGAAALASLASPVRAAEGARPKVAGDGRLFCYVGSWTEGRGGVGSHGGVHVLEVDRRNGAMTPVQSRDPEINAGYLAISPDSRSLYVNDERRDLGGIPGAGGGLTAYAIDPASGRLTRLNTVPSMGANPAYVSIDATGSRVTVANHASYEPVIRVVDGRIEKMFDDATIALFDTLSDGSVSPARSIATLDPGAGPTPRLSSGIPLTFAASPHAHSINWDPSSRWVLVCDKGADRLYTFRVEGSVLKRAHVFQAPAGSSPRHSAFHPALPLVFVVNEQVPVLDMYRFDAQSGVLHHLQAVETVDKLPAADGPIYLPADVRIHPTLPFVYATTRRADTIAVFRLSPAAPRLERVQVIASGGATPRCCTIDPEGRMLFVGNQDSGTIAAFGIDQDSGMLIDTGAVTRLPKPVCIKFAVL